MTRSSAARVRRATDVVDPFEAEFLALCPPGEGAELLSAFYRHAERRATEEMAAIARDIARTRAELRHFNSGHINEDLPVLGAELDAITRDTETATDSILSAAETIIALDANDPDLKDKADALVMGMFEACAFQDLVGQRVSKIVRVLKQIEERVGRLGDLAEDGDEHIDAAEQRRRDLILHGPAIGGPETTQAQVDAYFN